MIGTASNRQNHTRLLYPHQSLQAWRQASRVLAAIYSSYRKVHNNRPSNRTNDHGQVQPIDRGSRNQIMISWGQEILEILNIKLDVQGRAMSEPGLLVGNHLSYLDIAVILSQKPTLFLGKAELLRWPVIGKTMALVNMPTVKRSKTSSRRQARELIKEQIFGLRDSVCVFPSGTTSLDFNKPWRQGALALAGGGQVPCQGFFLDFKPRRTCAYIDRDTFIPHLIRLCRESSIEARLVWSEPFTVTDPVKQTAQLQDWCYQQSTDARLGQLS